MSREEHRRVHLRERHRLSAVIAVRERYADSGPTFAIEKLAEVNDLHLFKKTLRKLMMAAGLWTSRQAQRARVCQPRCRCDCLGELIQIVGYEHWCFEGRGPQCSLLVFVDDATSWLMQLQMMPTDRAFTYMQVMRAYIETHGKPVAVYSEKHSVFRVNTASARRGDGMTQFGRMLHDLNIEIICARSAPAKDRVEHVHLTPRDRLVKELRLAGVAGIAAAKNFLPGFMAARNARFAKPPTNPKDMHRPLAIHEDLDTASRQSMTLMIER